MSKKRKRETGDDEYTFWSKSPTEDQRHLSNFAFIKDGLTIPDDFPLEALRGKTFKAVENAFQACKWAMMKIDVPKELYESGKAKSLGGKKAFVSRGVALDLEQWNKVSTEYMEKLVKRRYEVDERFKKIIDDGKEKNQKFYHLETRGLKFWGCCKNKGTGEWKGENVLGQIYNRLGGQD